jgi:hypothetical protein
MESALSTGAAAKSMAIATATKPQLNLRMFTFRPPSFQERKRQKNARHRAIACRFPLPANSISLRLRWRVIFGKTGTSFAKASRLFNHS